MHHRSFDRIAGSSFEIARGGEKKKRIVKKIIILLYIPLYIFTDHSFETS